MTVPCDLSATPDPTEDRCNDDAPIDIAALTALCQAHPGPYFAAYEEGTLRVGGERWHMTITRPHADALQEPLEALTEMANAVPELLAMLAAAQADRDTYKKRLDDVLRVCDEYEARGAE